MTLLAFKQIPQGPRQICDIIPDKSNEDFRAQYNAFQCLRETDDSLYDEDTAQKAVSKSKADTTKYKPAWYLRIQGLAQVNHKNIGKSEQSIL